MKTKNTILMGLIAVLAIGLTVSCASKEPVKAEQTEPIDGASAVQKILEGLTESVQEAREIQMRLTAEQQQAFYIRHANAVKPDPGLELVREAKGVDAKLAQILENLKENTRTVQEQERARRQEINERNAAVNPYIQARQGVQE